MEQLETIRAYWNTRANGYSKSVMEEMEDARKEGTYWKTTFQKKTIQRYWILDADRAFLLCCLDRKDVR